ncbi:hypothetical protein O6H91_04G098700 [Diphasiastrum complanatum]|uniref:Uncharacterized protein n=1 Tax=Diphasiastrum complanatum TaxID=34168 RepID=A0ACC2DZW6_DIPCM|nr:hypothetical protein O6H91_04G098700 [Diphasiastrum complanatum]
MLERNDLAGEEERIRQRSRCRAKIYALDSCQRKYPKEPERGMLCKHLNHAAALCLVSFVCPDQVEAVQSYCSSLGTVSKQKRCREARESLEDCLAAHQD